MYIRTLTVLSLLGCQGTSRNDSVQAPTMVEVREMPGTGAGSAGSAGSAAHGPIAAQLRPGYPCRGTIGPIELIVGADPLVAQLGETRWSGEAGSAGVTLSRDGVATARIYPVGDPTGTSVLDTQGIPLIRISVAGTTASIADPSGRRVRQLTRHGQTIAVDQPPSVVTGTDDLVLAALLSAPELAPEVRVLTACERTFVHVVKGS